jgi:hypothetical protein
MTESPPPSIYQMLMFCGDSHLRQFREHAGVAIFSLTYFPGATMKGLASPRGAVGHRQAILALVTAPTPKTLFLMFGNVDLDVTWFRKSVLEGQIDEEDFFRQRCDALTAFVEDCRRVAGGTVGRVCVILPQLPTVADSHFVETTALTSRLDKRRLIELAATQDCSHLGRCLRTSRFNEYLSRNVPTGDDLGVYRIDDQMADETGLILPQFVREGAPNVHATEATLPLWQALLQDEVPEYRVMEELRRQALGQPPAVLQEPDD